MPYTVSGSVQIPTGPAPDGEDVQIWAWDGLSPGDGDLIGTVTISGGAGGFTSTVPDNTRQYFAKYDDGTYRGVSALGTPTGTGTWSTDATSGKAVPNSSTEWSAFLSSLGFGSAPNHLWLCQDAATPLVDAIGGVNLLATGTLTSAQYQKPITGWSRGAAYIAGTNGEWGNTGVCAPASDSVAMLVYAQIDTSGAVRSLFYATEGNGAVGADAVGVLHHSALGDARLRCDTATDASIATGHVANGVRPYLLVYNRTLGRVKLYTDKGVVAHTYAAGVVNGRTVLGRGNGSSTGSQNYLYAALWEGAAAEFTDTQARALLTGLGWDTSSWWTVDATSSKSYPASAVEARSFKDYNNLALPVPTSIWPMQQSSGGTATDANGIYNLTLDGSSLPTWSAAIAGHTRTGLQFVAGTTSVAYHLSIPNVNTNSGCLLQYAVPGTAHPSVTRNLMAYGANVDAMGMVQLSQASGSVMRVRNNNLINSAGALDTGAVIPLGLWQDLTSSITCGFDDDERLSPSPYAAIASSTRMWLGGSDGTAADLKTTCAYFWQGASAEAAAGFTAANLKAWIQAQGFTVGWT